MATALPGPLVTNIVGSVGDVTFYRSRGGLAIRNRVDPDQTATPARNAHWTTMRDLGTSWATVLTPQQRQDWAHYASRTPLPDHAGYLKTISPWAMFTHCNYHRRRFDVALASATPPTAPPLPRPTTALTVDANAETITLTVPPDLWPIPPINAALYVYLGDWQPPTINSYTTPYRAAGYVLYLPPWTPDPWTLPGRGTYSEGGSVWLKLIAEDLDTGAISTPSLLRAACP